MVSIEQPADEIKIEFLKPDLFRENGNLAILLETEQVYQQLPMQFASVEEQE